MGGGGGMGFSPKTFLNTYFGKFLGISSIFQEVLLKLLGREPLGPPQGPLRALKGAPKVKVGIIYETYFFLGFRQF